MFDAFISARLFSSIRGYIVDLIHQFGYAGMARAYGLAVAVGTVMLTIWFMWQGYRIGMELYEKYFQPTPEETAAEQPAPEAPAAAAS